jgi:bifunctional non-homologous end joining protein LigD
MPPDKIHAMPLGEYRKKRRFDVTSEPEGKDRPARRSKKKLAFVVQKHRASALHYDFRLEWGGVMLSWAVPRGPSYDPTIKRLAMQVEDHPIEYNEFEGIIPEGEYGGGTVMIWDHGTWTPEGDDVEAALKKGDLKFSMDGTKLKGSWVLVRTRGRPGDGKPAWLLIKHRDNWATTQDITLLAPRSAVTNRLLIEIARDEGGDLRKAADGDPPELLQKILENPKLLAPPKKKGKKKSVWHSNRPLS